MKQCTKCKQWKDESEFNKRKDSKDGLRTECKICQRDYNKNYYKVVPPLFQGIFTVNGKKQKEIQKQKE